MKKSQKSTNKTNIRMGGGDKLTNPKNKKMLLMGLVSLFVVAIISLGTYAIWNSELLTGDSSITTGQIKMSYTETNEITMDNALPMKDEEGKVLTDYFDFQVLSYVKTKGSDNTKRKIDYNIVLEPISVENALNDNEIKVYLTMIENGVETVVVEPTTIDQISDYILNNHEDIFSNNKSEVVTSYRLRSWIDSKVDTSKFSDKKYSYKFRVNVNSGNSAFSSSSVPLDESGANRPLLTSNMIPVYYDDASKEWKKASTTKGDTSNKWYDYDNKMWANAVTVTEVSYIDDITKDKNVSLTNQSIPAIPYTIFTSGGTGINNAKSYTKITVNTKSDGIFNFKATVSSEASYDKLTVMVSKNNGDAVTVANAISGNGVSKVYSDPASVGDVYVITAQYTKDGSNNASKDNGVLEILSYPVNTTITYIDSAAAGGTSGQDWTASGSADASNGVIYGNGITYNDSINKYILNNIERGTISDSLVGKYVCPTVNDMVCDTPYKVVEVSNMITKVDEYKRKGITRSDLINSEPGTIIPMSRINTMWVWVPRYTYTYFNTNTPQEIRIKFERGTRSTGTIKCVDAINQKDSNGNAISETCTDTTNNGLVAGTSTYTHPAFWWDKNDNNIREAGEELKGIWVGKFEVSSDITCTPYDSVAVGTGCNLQTIRPKVLPNADSWMGAQVGTFFNGIYNMRESGNQYGFSTRDETHMMKNMEWGAVAYLSHSKYGVNQEIKLNNCAHFKTGIGSYTVSDWWSTYPCYDNDNKYNGTYGKYASTTGNVYGVYDMSGGSYEYMMSNMVYSNGQQMSGWETDDNHNSAFTGILSDGTTFTGTYAFPSKRYYDKYSYGTSSTEYTRGKLGDATKEMALSKTTHSWYSDYDYFASSSAPWFYRGGYASSGVYAGAFGFDDGYGTAAEEYSSRAVISNLK